MPTLKEVYQSSNCGSDKGTDHNYLDTYEKLLSDKVDKPISLLEVGYYEGESAVLWSNYFKHPECTFDFLDINKPTNNFTNLTKCYLKQRVKFHIQDIIKIEEKSYFDKKYDIVIDDGSHHFKYQEATIQYFKDKLKPGGILVIEDVRIETTPWGDPPTFDSLINLLPFEVVDLRNITGRFDDVLLVYRNS
jgi:cephalosporin hydroxylase